MSWEDDSAGKVLVHQHEDLSLSSQHTHEEECNPIAEEEEGDFLSSLTASLAPDSVRASVSKIKVGNY